MANNFHVILLLFCCMLQLSHGQWNQDEDASKKKKPKIYFIGKVDWLKIF
jgi:hypothetical protein